MNLNIRTTRPTIGNKYYNTKSAGGYSTCIKGKPTDSQCDVLSNCVGNACAGFNEEHNFGYEKYHLNCNAENFIERAIASGLSVYKDPMIGGILVWQKGTLKSQDGAGHVEIVIDILEVDKNNKPTKIRTHSSGYGNPKTWWTTIRQIKDGNWGTNSPYKYRGCIAPEGYDPTPTPPQPGEKYKVGDKVVFDGQIYGDCDGGNPGQIYTNKVTVITEVMVGHVYPYHLENLGWAAEACLIPYVEPDFKVGDKVVPIELVNYKGVRLVQYDPYYTIMQIDNRGAVLGAPRNGKLVAWAVLALDNIKKIG